MKRNLLLAIISTLYIQLSLSAQTSGVYVVADNGESMRSCVDSSITLQQIIAQCGIRDLNDPGEDLGSYKMFAVDGSIVDQTEITGPIKYSDFDYVYVSKYPLSMTEEHSAVIIYTELLVPPTTLFIKDTLKYVVEKSAKQNFRKDFLDNLDNWAELGNVSFTDEATGIETVPGNAINYWNLGKGKYKIKMRISVCTPQDFYTDSMYVIIEESPCNNIEIKNMLSVCKDELIDITSYVYLNNQLATSTDISSMTFWNRSNTLNPNAGLQLNPTAIDMKDMADKVSLYPTIEITYQPNIQLGICNTYSTLLTTKVPAPIHTVENTIRTKTNQGRIVEYEVDSVFYGFNNSFNKSAFQKIYLDNFNVFTGTSLNFYSDNLYQHLISTNTVSPGTYYILTTNPACDNDSTTFKVKVKNRDFDINWFYESNLGKGYYTFIAPSYPGATYSWMNWSGAIVSGLNTNQITVYYSEDAAKSTSVSCKITLATARTTTGASELHSAVYLTSNSTDAKEEISTALPLSTVTSNSKTFSYAYPNPNEGSFALSGSGLFNLKIYNTVGQLVYVNESYEANTPISLSDKGMYVVYLSQQHVTQTIKVVLK